MLMGSQTVYGYTFREGRFDVGNKLDYLRATVELALERDDLGPAFRRYLIDRVDRERESRGNLDGSAIQVPVGSPEPEAGEHGR